MHILFAGCHGELECVSSQLRAWNNLVHALDEAGGIGTDLMAVEDMKPAQAVHGLSGEPGKRNKHEALY